MDLFPGTKLGIGPAIEDGFYYDFDLPRPLTPDDLAAIEARMAESRRGRPPVRPPGAAAGRGAGLLRRARPAVQGRDPRRPRRDGRRPYGEPMPPVVDLRARPVHRPVQGPARRVHGQARAVQAARGRRRVLARRRGAADAPAHLRHGLGDPGGARPLPVAARGGAQARPPAAGRPARPVQLPRRLARAPRSGTPRARRSGARSRARCASSRSGAATRRSARRSSSTRSCGSSRATGTTTATTCSWSRPRARRSASSR